MALVSWWRSSRSPSAAMGILERIKEIELEMSRTQKNKATEYHLGQLKVRACALLSSAGRDSCRAAAVSS